ncbi:olfactomedin-4-like [Lethenteron reissneri]|uniref:olfactomedin-4-like n=1 Tax=Lethenteron reissneri TaxID=7753 RepID=UPI002AB70846|nr:olfactomedin-4-like [Lethenteron reissneri]
MASHPAFTMKTSCVGIVCTILLLPRAAVSSALIPGAYTNGSRDAEGQCVCHVYLPDPVFPADAVEQLQLRTQTLATAVTLESQKVAENHAMLVRYTAQLRNLTVRVERMEQGHDRYTELDFELLRVEIREMEQLVQQLKLEVSSATLDHLHLSIQNVSVVVNTLEAYDRNNVLLIRRQVDTLRKRLENCQEETNATMRLPSMTPSRPPSNNLTQPRRNKPIQHPSNVAGQPSIGACRHGGLQNASASHIHGLNWQGVGAIYGAFGKDPLPARGREDMYWVMSSSANSFTSFQLYANYRAMQTFVKMEQRQMQCNYDCGHGMDVVVYKNNLFYRCSTGNVMCKYSLSTFSIKRAQLPQAAGNNKFPYLGSAYSDMDFCVDEQGLWVIYSNDSKVSLANINDDSLQVINTWTTSQYKPSVSNGFMVCGVLYLTRTFSLEAEEIYFAFDTNTNQERSLSIVIDKPLEKMSSLSYNPADHKLYMYNQGYLVTHKLSFKHV